MKISSSCLFSSSPFYLIGNRLVSKKYIKRVYHSLDGELLEYLIRRDIVKQIANNKLYGITFEEEKFISDINFFPKKNTFLSKQYIVNGTVANIKVMRKGIRRKPVKVNKCYALRSKTGISTVAFQYHVSNDTWTSIKKWEV